MSDKGSVDYLPWRAPEVEDSRDLRPIGTEAARKLAWEQGYSDGYTVGIEAGTRDARQRMTQLHEILESLAKPFSNLDEHVSDQLTALVRTLTEQLVRREISMDQSVLAKLIDEGLQALPVAASEVQIIVNPDDANFMREHMEEQSEAGWRIQTDANLSRGGCRIVSGLTQIDASVETRLTRLIESMTESEGSPDAAV